MFKIIMLAKQKKGFLRVQPYIRKLSSFNNKSTEEMKKQVPPIRSTENYKPLETTRSKTEGGSSTNSYMDFTRKFETKRYLVIASFILLCVLMMRTLKQNDPQNSLDPKDKIRGMQQDRKRQIQIRKEFKKSSEYNVKDDMIKKCKESKNYFKLTDDIFLKIIDLSDKTFIAEKMIKRRVESDGESK